MSAAAADTGPQGARGRVETAEALLAEAVYRSREVQAALASLAAPAGGSCGLGAKAAVALDLTPRAELLFHELWPTPPSASELTRLRGVLAAWVEAQDALDRKRNHFLKAFRHKHGFARRAYGPSELAAYEEGLARINAEQTAALRASALELLGQPA